MQRVRAPKRCHNCPKSRVSSTRSLYPRPTTFKTQQNLRPISTKQPNDDDIFIFGRAQRTTRRTTTRHMRDLSTRALHMPPHGQCDPAHLRYPAPSFTSSPRCEVQATLSLPQASVERVPDHRGRGTNDHPKMTMHYPSRTM